VEVGAGADGVEVGETAALKKKNDSIWKRKLSNQKG
jgi:hypothetical protein